MVKAGLRHDTEPVSWVSGPHGADPEAELVRQAMVERGVTTYGALVADLAERLFARDNACVGNVGDIGFFRAWYALPALRLVERLDGTVLRIGGPVHARSSGRP